MSGASVYRLQGTGSDRGSPFPWSLILKFCTNAGRFAPDFAPEDPAWQREYLLGKSKLLDELSCGLRVPRFSDGLWQSATEIALWFEDLGSDWAKDWTIDRYGLAAFHLGQFNALYAGRPPQENWLGRDQ